ncbi:MULTISPECIES: restriction endonuclease [Mesorhizobium]|uniref:Restriction endonuclease n=1 Tax=Mesorhizobium calcicola TaxID=1300310 RepID=A0ABW4WEQ3_9HYPH|nr:restriction endonuclease [Mesorhizobium sophorae]
MSGEIKAVDLKLVGDLFGDGYVMDFTNRTYQEFFRDDVGVDIYNDAYLIDNANSKGKRLRAFMQKAQKSAIVKALHGLWEYRVAYIAGHEDCVPQGRERLSALVERLGGKPIPGAATPEPNAPLGRGLTESTQVDLENEFMVLHGMDDAAQARGYAFEKFLKRWFDAWGLEPRKAFKLKGEQIDGSFLHGNTVYFLEAKWRNGQTGAAELRSFQELIGQHFEGARGLFVSYSGFTPEGLQAFVARRIVMMDGMDVVEALRRRISLEKIVAKKLRIAIEERRPKVSVRELFP